MRTAAATRPAADLDFAEPISSRPPALALVPTATTSLAHGRALSIGGADDAPDHVIVHDPSGHVELTIRITPAGPVLELRAVALKLEARDIAIACEVLHTSASKRIETSTQGDIVVEASGKFHTHVGGGVRLAGRDVRLDADRGEVSLRARDDLRIDGATVLINS